MRQRLKRKPIIHVGVQQKLIQLYKAIILQFLKNLIKTLKKTKKKRPRVSHALLKYQAPETF